MRVSETGKGKQLRDKCIVNLQGTVGFLGEKGSPGEPGSSVSKMSY